MRIPCPHCGERDYTEFRYGGDATKARPAHGSGDFKAWHDYVFLFDNPKGAHREFWQHVQGCRQWLVLERDTATNVVGRSWLAREQSTGEQSTGEQSTGEQSTGEQSTGEQSTGEQSADEQSAGEQSAGEQSAGEQSAGEQSAGEASRG